MKRPGLESMLADACMRSDVDVVLAWDRNRLARPKDPVDGMLLERRLIEAGKRVIYASTGQEADRSFAGGLLSYVEHHQNGDYLRKLSRDTMRGLVARAKRGRWTGGPIPFGFDRLILDGDMPKRIVRDLKDGSQAIIDPATGDVVERLPMDRSHKKQDHETCTLIPSDPARVRALQKMFADYAGGKPTRQLRDDLNAAGFRTSRGSRFSIATIHPILDNPAYLGQCVYNRRTLSKWHRFQGGSSVERQDEGVEKRDESEWIVTENAWPALVNAEQFACVRTRRQDSRERHRHTTGSAVRSPYLSWGAQNRPLPGASKTGHS